MVYVDPLKVPPTEAFRALTGDPVPSRFQASSWSEVRTPFVVYSAEWTACSLTILLLFRHALSRSKDLALNTRAVWETAIEIQG